jgi:hypothetical protein
MQEAGYLPNLGRLGDGRETLRPVHAASLATADPR